MNESLLREIAEQIAREQLLLQWPLYLLMAGIAIVVGFAAAFVGAYAKKRGESFATKADFDSLLSQVKATTAVAEEVKAQVSHADWASRELKTLRRIKLEELLQAVHEVQSWQDLERRRLIFSSGKDSGASPIPTIERICGLYFPELQACIHSFSQLHRQMMIATLDTGQKLLAAGQNFAEQQVLRQQYQDSLLAIYQKQLAAVNVIEKEARKLMGGLVGA